VLRNTDHYLLKPSRILKLDSFEAAGILRGVSRACGYRVDKFLSDLHIFSLVVEEVGHLRSSNRIPRTNVALVDPVFSMQSSTLRRDHSYISLGERRGKSDLARFSLDLSWARAVSDSARSRAYPSPPMSGSPPLPPRRNPESSDRGHGSYGTSGQEVYRGIQTPQMEHGEQQRGPPPMRAYAPDQGQTMPYPGPYNLASMSHPPMQYQQQLPQMVSQPPPPLQQPQQHHHGYAPHPPQPPAPFSTPDRPPISQTSEFTSPKQQRKTKGHVASACVPCKRAHLR
jgi:hypothetical protein